MGKIMTVAELIQELQNIHDPEMEVIFSDVYYAINGDAVHSAIVQDGKVILCN